MLAKIAEIPEADRRMAERLHPASKFKERNATFGFNAAATSTKRHVADLLRAEGVDHRR